MGYALVNVNVVLETESCGVCGTHFAMPDTLKRAALKDHSIFFWCPMGHRVHYTGETEASTLRKELEAERARKEAALTRANEAERASLKLSRKLKRVRKGVCPECNRSFLDLARHMACKHADSPRKS